jgi:transcriptional regulator with XRE-family HTH domain
MTIGKRIKQRRKELKMSADELAKRLGKNRATIYRYEDGFIENLPLDILEPLSAALLTTPQYLMGWEEKIEKDPVGTAELHFEILMDEDINDIFEDFKVLDGQQRQLVKDLIHNMAQAKKEV